MHHAKASLQGSAVGTVLEFRRWRQQRELLKFQATGLLGGSYRQLGRMRNPFLQSFEIEVNDRDLLYWKPGKRPKVLSLRGVLRLLRRRG